MLTITEPEPTPELTGHRAILENYCSSDAESFVIETAEQAQMAADLLNDCKARLKALKEGETLMTEDFVKGINKIKALFAPAFEAGDRAMKLWKRKIAESEQRRREIAAQAMQEAAAAVQAGNGAAAQAAIVRVQPVERLQGVTKRRVWKFEIVNPKLIPADWLKPDEQAIRKTMQEVVASGSEPVIPGVRFYQEEQIAATG